MDLMLKVAIIFIGTSKYASFFENYYTNCREKFLPNIEKTFFFFTDAEIDGDLPEDIVLVNIEHKTWPLVTLGRFSSILLEKNRLCDYDYIVYLDADMLVNDVVLENEILDHDKDFIGVYHPGFYKKNQTMPYERRPISTAFIDIEGEIYWQGCMWGGKTSSIIQMCEDICERIEQDEKNNIIAVWYDESHLNKYFLENIDKVYTLNPEYAFPAIYDQDPNRTFNYPNINPNIRKIIHVHKDSSSLHVTTNNVSKSETGDIFYSYKN